jgi:hypothetical protein
MTTYYKHGKIVTAFNELALDKTASFNANTAITAAYAIDDIPGEVEFVERPRYLSQKDQDLVARRHIVGFDPGEINLPSHPVRSGFWLNYAGFSAATGAGKTSHDLVTRSSGPYYFSMKGSMKHTTTAENVVQDACGCYMTKFHWEWGQDRPLSAAHQIKFAKLVTGNSTARNTELDAKGAFVAGNVSYVNAYNSTTLGCVAIGGLLDIDLRWMTIKAGSSYITDAIYLGKEYRLSLDVLCFNDNLLNLPKDPQSYATALTYDINWWRSSKTADHMRASFTNLCLEQPLGLKKIDQDDYIYKGTAVFVNSATTKGNLIFKIVDAFSGDKYESA